MKYLSVCSGIEAASVAWETLGWEQAKKNARTGLDIRLVETVWPYR